MAMNEFDIEEENEVNTTDIDNTANDTLKAARNSAGQAAERQVDAANPVEQSAATPTEQKNAKPVDQKSEDVPAEKQQPSKPTFTDDEFIDRIKSKIGYSQEELDSMTDEQYGRYHEVAGKYRKDHPDADTLRKRLELADELQKKAKYVAEHTADEEDLKDDHDEAQYASDFLVNHTSKFTKMDDEGLNLWETKINSMYDAANKRRGHVEVAADGLKRGLFSAQNMLYQGWKMFEPGEMTQEDADLIKASMQVKKDDEIANPTRIGGLKDVDFTSVGDVCDYLIEGAAENLPRTAVTVAAATLGATMAPWIGASAATGSVVFGAMGGMLLNTGEAVQDQMDENRNDGDIRNSRGWARAQGFLYSLVEGSFGVSRYGSKILSSVLRKAGAKNMADALVKNGTREWAKDAVKKSTIKGAATELVLKGGVGEGIEEDLQSQVVGRGIRYFQTGSMFRKKDDGSYETPGEAFMEALDEFAGGMSAGLTLGLIGGVTGHADARRTVNTYKNMSTLLDEDKNYQQLDDYGKLLVKRHIANDSMLSTTETIKPEIQESLKKSNSEIDDEIDRMMKSGKENDRLIGQSARLYLDIFNSEYSVKGIDGLFSKVDGSDTEYRSRDGKSYKSNLNIREMLDNAEQIKDKNGNEAVVYNCPNTHIKIAQFLDKDGRPNGKYTFINDPARKSPMYGPEDLECKSFEDAVDKAHQLDCYNQWRAEKMMSKAQTANAVFDKLYGRRGFNLKFIDRPTNGDASVGVSVAALDPEKRTVELSLDSINSLGRLYTTLIHERGHADIVEFLMQSGKWTKMVGVKKITDWDQFYKDREVLFSKVAGAEEMSAKYREKDAKKKEGAIEYDKVKTEWGKSAGTAGEEMIVERASVYDLAERLRSAERGIFGSLEDKIRSAIGMKMAGDMGLDPMQITPSDVSEEIKKISDLGYVGHRAPVGFEKKQAEYTAPGASVGKESASANEGADAESGSKNTDTASKPSYSTFKPSSAQMKNGEGASLKPRTVVRRADGRTFEKYENEDGTYGWYDSSSKSSDAALVDDETATQGGYSVVYDNAEPSATNETAEGEQTEQNEAPAATEKPTEESVNAEAEGAKESVETETSEAKPTESTETAKEQPQEPLKSPEGQTAQVKDEKPAEDVSGPSGEATEQKSAPVEDNDGDTEETKQSSEESKQASEVVANPTEEKKPATEAVKRPSEEAKPAKTSASETQKEEKAEEGKPAWKKMPKTAKKLIAKQTGLDEKAITPEVENRWVDLDELEPGTTVRIGGKKYTKAESEDKKADRSWVGGDGKKTTQMLLARSGDFKVVETTKKAKAAVKKAERNEEKAKAESSAEKKFVSTREIATRLTGGEDDYRKQYWNGLSKENRLKFMSDLLAENANKNTRKGIEDIISVNLGKTVLDEFTKRYDEVVAEAGVSPLEEASDKKENKDEKKEVERSEEKDTPAVAQLKETISDESFSFLSDGQREFILQLGKDGNDITAITKAKIGEGLVIVKTSSGNSIVDGTGRKLTNEEALAVISRAHNGSMDGKGGESVGKRAKTVLSMQKVQELDSRDLHFDYMSSKGVELSKYNGLSDDVLLAKTAKDQDYDAFSVLWNRWVVNPPKRLNGGVQEWFLDHGVAKEELPNLLDRLWNDSVKALEESNFLESERIASENAADELDRAVEKITRKKNASREITLRGTPLGTEVTAESFFYSLMNEMIGEKDAERERERMKAIADRYDEAERERERMRNESQMAEDIANALESGKSIEKIRAERRASTLFQIPERYVEMDAPQLFRSCIATKGKSPDMIAREEVKMEIKDYLLKNCGNGKSVIENLMGMTGTAYAGDAIDHVIRVIEEQWNDPPIGCLWTKEKSSKADLEHLVTNIAKNFARKKFSEVVTTSSLDDLLSKAGDAAEYDPDNEVYSSEKKKFDIIDGRRTRSEGTQFDVAMRGYRNLIGAKIINGQAEALITELVECWKERVNNAYMAIDEAKGGGHLPKGGMKALIEERARANRLDFMDDEMVAKAAHRLNMKPLVYRARLGRLLSDIEFALLSERGEEGFRHAKSRMARGLISSDEASRIAEYNPGGDYQYGFDDSDIRAAMQYNGDGLMLWCVSNADSGMSISKMEKILSEGLKGRGELAKMSNRRGLKTAVMLLDAAYTDYGWINKNDNVETIVARLIDTYHSDVKVGQDLHKAIMSGEYDPIVRRIAGWFDAKGIGHRKNEARKAFQSIMKGLARPETARERSKAARDSIVNDHLYLRKLMSENGNDEAAVRKILAGEGNDEKRVTSMFKHFNSREKDLLKEFEKRAAKEAEKESKRGLTEKEKARVDEAFEEAGFDVGTALNAVVNAGLNRDKAQNRLQYLKSLKDSEDERKMRSTPMYERKEMLKQAALATGEDFKTKPQLLTFAKESLFMDPLLANTVIDMARPPQADAFSIEDIQERGEQFKGKIGMFPSEIKRVNAELDKEKAEDKTGYAKRAAHDRKQREDAEAIKKIVDKVGSLQGAVDELRETDKDKAANLTKVLVASGLTEEEARKVATEQSSKGLSEKRVREMVKNYFDVYGMDEGSPASSSEGQGSSPGKRAKTITITFDVNGYAGCPDSVTVSGTTPKQVINKALRASCKGKFYHYDSISLIPKDRNGRLLSNFGKLTSDELNNAEKLKLISDTFGFEPTEKTGGNPRKGSDGEGRAGVSSGVADSERRAGSSEGVRQGDGHNRVYVEPEDPELAQRYRERHGIGGKRWKTITTPDDKDAVSGSIESQKTHGFLDEDYNGRARKKDAELDEEARTLMARREEYDKAVERAINGGALTDEEVRAMTLDLGERMADGISARLTAEESESNEKAMDRLSKALVSALSKAGAALNQAKHGFNIRTRDTDVYIMAQVRAKLEKSLPHDVSGSEVEKRLESLRARIKEQAAELAKAHDIIESQRKEIARKNDIADEKAMKRVADEAYKAGYDAATEQGRRERESRIASLASKYGFSDDKVDQADVALSGLEALFNVGRRSAGNPRVVLTDAHKTMFAALFDAADKNEEVARKAIIDRIGERAIPFFEQYLEEERAAAKDEVPPKKKPRANRRHASGVANPVESASSDATQSAEVAEPSEDVAESEDEDVKAAREKVFSRNVSERAKKVAPKDGKSRASLINRLRNRAGNTNIMARHATERADAMAAIGESARAWFKLIAILNGNNVEEAKKSTLDRMNDTSPDYSFTESDLKDAILGRGEFKPIGKEKAKVTYANLKKAIDLAKAGKTQEAAKMAGIKNPSPSKLLEELETRLERSLDKKLNVFESRINEADNSKLGKQISDIIFALREIRTGDKPVNELLSKYLDLVAGMSEFRKQMSVLERIQSKADMYERKIAENDFEPQVKREAPDTSKELRDIYHAMRRLEKMRERFKHERDSWKIKKEPAGTRFVSSIVDILGETKALVGSMDLSSILRQGGQMTWAHPFLFSKNLIRTIKAFKSEEYANAVMDDIYDRPNAQYYLKAGIEFTDWGENASNQADQFLLNHYRKFTNIKLLKKGIECSERAFSMYLNMMRADVFDAMIKNSTFRGADGMTQEQLKAVGNFINIASQRGAIDRNSALGKAIPMLNTVLWSPRNVYSRFQFIANTLTLMAPGFKSYGTTDWTMRRMFAMETLRYFTGVAIAIMFTKLMADLFRGDDEPPEEIVKDPTSSDFLKVKIGDTRLDFMSGLQQMFVFSMRALSHKTTNLRGEVKELKNPSDYYGLFTRFARTKFSPMASFIWDTALARETFDRQDISYSPSDQLTNNKDVIGFTRYAGKSLFCPLSFSDMLEQAKQGGIGRTVLSWMLTALGAGVQTFDPFTYKQMSNDFRYFKRLYRDAETQEERDDIVRRHPMLKMSGPIDDILKRIGRMERTMKKAEEAGGDVRDYRDAIDLEKKRAINLMAGFRHPMEAE